MLVDRHQEQAFWTGSLHLASLGRALETTCCPSQSFQVHIRGSNGRAFLSQSSQCENILCRARATGAAASAAAFAGEDMYLHAEHSAASCDGDAGGHLSRAGRVLGQWAAPCFRGRTSWQVRHSPIAQQSLKPPAGMSCAVLSLPVASMSCKTLTILMKALQMMLRCWLRPYVQGRHSQHT